MKSTVLIGKRFGKWTVIGKAPRRNKKQSYSICQCDCGAIKEVSNSGLRRGKSTSCGCKNRVTNPRLNYIRNTRQSSAHGRNIPYDLPDNLLEELSNKPCYYCGALPSNHSYVASKLIIYQGIDRKDPNQGYIPDNVIPCCRVCNRAKMDMSYSEFMEWINGLVKHQVNNIRGNNGDLDHPLLVQN